MTTYSILITGTREELLAFLGSSKKVAKGSTIEAFHQNMINLHEGRSVSQRDQVQSCAYCGKPIEGANGRQFCSSRCNCLFVCYPTNAVKCPRIDNLYGKENISKPNRSIDAEAKREVLTYIRSCLRHGLDYSDILFSLKQLKGISLSPAELAGYLEEL
jgi:hypothetical protein